MKITELTHYRTDITEAIVDEMAGQFHKDIGKILADKGYEFINGGIDKQVYLDTRNDTILVIFGYRPGYNNFSPDQLMFARWARYCKKHSDNPHLPRFSDWASFTYGGKTYLQIRMEKLSELPDEIGYLVGHIEEALIRQRKQDFDEAFKTLTKWAQHDSDDAGEAMYYDLKTAISLLGGKKAAYSLLKTVYKLSKFGRKHGFSIDLHKGNYMQRDNGTIVVNDPFVLFAYNEV